MKKIYKFIYHKILRPSRLKMEVSKVNLLPGKTILDIGYFDSYTKKLLRKDFIYFGIDPSPAEKIGNMPLVSIENFKTNKKFDIVIAFDILEHTYDPVSVIKKIKNMSNKYVCVSIPYEPFYTISRLFIPEKEHFWTLHPQTLEYYFGKPIYEKKLHFRRSYFAIYEIK